MRELLRSDQVSTWLTLVARPWLALNLFKKQADRPTIYFVVHNRSHVEIVHRTAGYLALLPVKIQFCLPRASDQARFARNSLNEFDLSWIPPSKMTVCLGGRDAVVVLANLSPRAVKIALEKAWQVGTVRISVMEGARFTKKNC